MKIIGNVFLFFSILILGLWLFKFTSPLLRIDGYTGFVFEKLDPVSPTIYAPHYSHEKFLHITTGMPETEVIKTLGEPLQRWNPRPGVIGLEYSRSSRKDDYRLREIYISKGRVIKIDAFYYFD